MKKLFITFLIWALGKVFASDSRNLIEPTIAWMYAAMKADVSSIKSKIEEVLSSKQKEELKPYLTKLYQKIAKEDFRLKHKVLSVKKGKRRYDVLFVETPTGKVKVTLGRHTEKTKEIPVISQN